MSMTGTTLRSRPTPAAPGDGAGCDRYIEQQLDRTQFHVRITDLCSALMVLAGGVLGVLLTAAIIDHWVVSLGTLGRWLAFLAIVAGCAYYSAAILVPLLWRPINPVYAARAIEQSQPTLKNSLINFLLFRSDRAGVRAAIYQALEQRAAADLSHVRVETAVDRSRLIKIGYVLTGVLAFCAAYAILTPKSPWQSVARVLVPWAEIATPSRVRIEEVQPGHTKVYQGATITVSARCYDVRDDEPVMLFYSSLDGRVTDRPAEMNRQDGALTYACQLPEEPGAGIQQDFVYWIEAGDVRTPTYQVQVTPTPTILVERVEYEHPAYTNLPKRIVEQRGDIQALEGTRVTVRARANRAIASALLELDPVASSADAKATPGQAASAPPPSSPQRVEMQFRDEEAWCSFYLELDQERAAPKHRSYQLRFTAVEGERNLQPVLHRIEVIRDLSPEVEILQPTNRRVEVAENGHLKIEVRAVDPDFGLREVRLRAVTGGQAVLDQVLVQDAQGRSGQAMTDFDFQPRSLSLHAGDQVTYWAIAEDNRCEPQTGKPAPNTAKTDDYTLVIVAPESRTSPSEQPAEKQPSEEPVPDAPKPGDPPADEPPAPKNDDGPKEKESGESKDEKSEPGGEKSQPAGAGSGSKDQGQQEPSGKSEASGGGSSSDAGGTGAKSQQGESQSGSNTSDGSQQGEPSSGDETQDGAEAGQDGASGNKRNSQGGNSQVGSEVTTGDQASDGAPEEPLHDGEVFEKTLEHLAKTQQGGAKKQDPQGKGQASAKPRPAGDGEERAEPGANPAEAAGKPKPGQNQPLDGTKQKPDGAGTQDTHSPDVKPGAKSAPDPAGKLEPNPQQPDKSEGPGQQQPGGPSAGGTPQGPMETRSEGEPKSPQPDESPQPGQGDSGDSGAGQNSADKTGAGPGLKENRDRPKSGDSDASQPKPDDEPQTPSESKHQSDSKGGEGGDRSGGGEKGHGQGANQPGSDSAGSNTSADEGAGASKESGSGETSGKAGGKEQADRKTGASGTEAGPGTGSRAGKPDAGGSGSPQEPGQSAGGQPKPAPPGGAKRPTDGQGAPAGGGTPANSELAGSPPTGEVPPGEKPNVEYANKATDMVLEYLKDQQSKPDPELLEKLGWTEEDLRAFVRRWEAMKQSAVEDQAARRDLNESLRSLGLRPTRQTVRSVDAPADVRREARNVGSHSNPPPGYSELFDAYRKGTARAK